MEIGFLDTPGGAWGVAVVGGLAYVADLGGSLHVIDVSNPATPAEVGFIDTPDDALGVAVVGSLADVTNGASGLRVIEATLVPEPRVLLLQLAAAATVLGLRGQRRRRRLVDAGMGAPASAPEAQCPDGSGLRVTAHRAQARAGVSSPLCSSAEAARRKRNRPR